MIMNQEVDGWTKINHFDLFWTLMLAPNNIRSIPSFALDGKKDTFRNDSPIESLHNVPKKYSLLCLCWELPSCWIRLVKTKLTSWPAQLIWLICFHWCIDRPWNGVGRCNRWESQRFESQMTGKPFNQWGRADLQIFEVGTLSWAVAGGCRGGL